MQALLEAGADVYSDSAQMQSRGGGNSVVLAAEGGSEGVLRLLLDAGGGDPGSR